MIYIYKGDDSNFDNNQLLKFRVDSAKGLEGWSARFELCEISCDFENLTVENTIVITAEESATLPDGELKGSLILFDQHKRRKTVISTIPFFASRNVKQNKPETIIVKANDEIPSDINISVGTTYLKIDDIKAGNNINILKQGGYCVIEALTPSVENFATKQDLVTGLETRQPKGNYVTEAEVMQAIASIPQFKLSIVSELPTVGEKMTLYLVPKEGVLRDIYNEYIWIEATNSFEFIGTTAVDLTDYVKNTDYATQTNGGISKMWVSTDENGDIGLNISTEA